MSVHLSPLITGQLRTVLVMMAAGIFVESLWQARCLLLHPRQNPAIRTLARSPRLCRAVIDIHFWIAAAFILSTFLYYCTWGRLAVHAGVGFLAGLLLWKKMCCAIIRT